jgi:hypothetical protein
VGFFKNLFSQPTIDWSLHASLESALILDSLAEYFGEIPDALEAMGAKREGSKMYSDKAVDLWTLPNGQTVYAGYRKVKGDTDAALRAIRSKAGGKARVQGPEVSKEIIESAATAMMFSEWITGGQEVDDESVVAILERLKQAAGLAGDGLEARARSVHKALQAAVPIQKCEKIAAASLAFSMQSGASSEMIEDFLQRFFFLSYDEAKASCSALF